MNEAEWLTSEDTFLLLSSLDPCVDDEEADGPTFIGERPLRLFACACSRYLLARSPTGTDATTILLGERYADGAATMDELEAHYELVKDTEPGLFTCCVQHNGSIGTFWDIPSPRVYLWEVCSAFEHRLFSIKEVFDSPERQALCMVACALLRDIIGNPFRRVTFDPTWRTPDTVGIALKMYDERGFFAMPILADALEEAGCDNVAVLAHCREPSVHVRGCWVVDGVLGKRAEVRGRENDETGADTPA